MGDGWMGRWGDRRMNGGVQVDGSMGGEVVGLMIFMAHILSTSAASKN